MANAFQDGMNIPNVRVGVKAAGEQQLSISGNSCTTDSGFMLQDVTTWLGKIVTKEIL
jgi:hypothetical protein